MVSDSEVVLANRAFARLTGEDPTGHRVRDARPATPGANAVRDAQLAAPAHNAAPLDPAARVDALAGLVDPGHGARVAHLAVALAEIRGWEPGAQARVHQAARLHDVGKAVLPDAPLTRPGPLTEPEREHVRQHARVGAELAAGALDAEQASWIRHHHERHDGTGYPDRLAGDAIPDGAALIAMADAWDTLTSGRPYRAPLDPNDALRTIDADAGTHLVPAAGSLLRAALNWLDRA